MSGDHRKRNDRPKCSQAMLRSTWEAWLARYNITPPEFSPILDLGAKPLVGHRSGLADVLIRVYDAAAWLQRRVRKYPRYPMFTRNLNYVASFPHINSRISAPMPHHGFSTRSNSRTVTRKVTSSPVWN